MPPPPPGSVWERIERARDERGIKYAKFDDMAGRTQGHYRGIAVRNGWSAGDEIRDSYVRAAVKLGYSELWLQLGVGEREQVAAGQTTLPIVPPKKPRKPTEREMRALLGRAQEELENEDFLDPDEAAAIMDEVETDVAPRIGLTWEDLYESAQGVAKERAYQRERERRQAEAEAAARRRERAMKDPAGSIGKPGARRSSGGDTKK